MTGRIVFCDDVCQVLRLTGGQYFVRDGCDLVLYSLGDGQPMQCFEHWLNVITPRSTRHNTCQMILNALELVKVLLRGVIQQCVAVVKPGVDNAACNHIGHLPAEHWTDMLQSPDMKIAGLHNIFYVIIKCKALVECHSEAFEFH